MLSRFLSGRGDLTRGEDPFALIQRELGRVVEDAFRGAPMAIRGGLGWSPSLDVRETPDGLELTVELPGVREEDITLSLEGEVLSLRGEKTEERRSEERGVHIQERSYGGFQRSLRLPFAPEPGRVSAEFDKGVLRVTLPRPETQAQRDNRIPIRGAAGAAAGQASGAGPAAGSGQEATGGTIGSGREATGGTTGSGRGGPSGGTTTTSGEGAAPATPR